MARTEPKLHPLEPRQTRSAWSATICSATKVGPRTKFSVPRAVFECVCIFVLPSPCVRIDPHLCGIHCYHPGSYKSNKVNNVIASFVFHFSISTSAYYATCLHFFSSREGVNTPLPLSTVTSEFVYTHLEVHTRGQKVELDRLHTRGQRVLELAESTANHPSLCKCFQENTSA